MRVEPFEIHVGDEVLDDLRARIANTRWPPPAPGEKWSQGTDLDYLRGILDYWADGFDWRAQEERLNRHDHFLADIDGCKIHFVHARAQPTGGIPIVITNGWPSNFVELLELVPHLGRFDVVIPSLPGYGFSERPRRTGVNYRYVAGMWHRLMRGLGYERYGAQGGDFGAGVATLMALDEPDSMIGIHLSTVELDPPNTGEPLTEAERGYLAQQQHWDDTERGYSSIQSTKPQTVGYGLNDSPAGLAAWVLEKWRSWSDSGGDLDTHVDRDLLLTVLTVYWATQSITPSMRDYYDNRWHGVELGPADQVEVPTAFAGFDNHFVPEGKAPREWLERLYDVRRWTPMPSGGHFAPAEQPERLARDIAEFFGGLRSASGSG